MAVACQLACGLGAGLSQGLWQVQEQLELASGIRHQMHTPERLGDSGLREHAPRRSGGFPRWPPLRLRKWRPANAPLAVSMNLR